MTRDFQEIYRNVNQPEILKTLNSFKETQVKEVLQKEELSFADFTVLLSPAAGKYLKEMAVLAKQKTLKHFGKTIQFYVPLYLSNECNNSCLYCGFNKDQKIERKTLNFPEIEAELKQLQKLGFKNILLLTGEAKKQADKDYIEKAVKLTRKYFPYVSLEIFPAEEKEYHDLVQAGASGLTIYQETYHKETYQKVHPLGPKKDFLLRLDTPEKALEAGFRKIGLGALLGLYDWRFEAYFIALHAQYLAKKYWKSEFSISFPRLKSFPKDFQPEYKVQDKYLVQLILSLRLFLPWAGLTLSTREAPNLRDNLMEIGITQISAESKTSPGGYAKLSASGEQFTVADTRSLKTLKEVVKQKGYDPVLKDWAEEFTGVDR